MHVAATISRPQASHTQRVPVVGDGGPVSQFTGSGDVGFMGTGAREFASRVPESSTCWIRTRNLLSLARQVFPYFPIPTATMRAARFRLPAALLFATLISACGDDPLAPDQATTSFTASTATEISGTVGQPVTSVPSVRATDASGNPVAGLSVSFTATGGGTLGRQTATTDANGTASVGSWTLGTSAGTQTVTATAGSRTVTFTANAGAGAAATITAVAGATNAALTGAAVPNRPSVQIKDQFGNSVAGAPVVFSVESGGGAVTGGSATTDASGTATVGGWTLGVQPGTQSLRATSGSLSAQFTASASLPTGCVAAPYAIGATIPGAWAAGDCANSTRWAAAGAVYDQYELKLDAQRNVRFELTGAAGRSLRIRRADAEDFVGLPLSGPFTTVEGNTLITRHLLEAGDYVLEVQAPASTTGEYTLTSAIDDSDIVCRPVVQATIGTTFQGALNPATDCESPVAPGTYEDWVVLPLKTGDKFRITLTTTTMPPGFVLRDDRLGPASPTLAVRTSNVPGTITLDWTATFDTYHEIVIFRNGGPNTPYGPYTLKIERLP